MPPRSRPPSRPNTAAFLVEPIQGEGGIVVPPAGYLAQAAEICRARNVLLICDEIQTGLGRTGRMLASQHDGVAPDAVLLGKALGGGLLPVSLFLARREVMDVFQPGDHGSTFGGNPIAAAVGLAALDTLVEERLVERSAALGPHLLSRLASLDNPLVREVRGRGLFAGIELDATKVRAGMVAERLLGAGILEQGNPSQHHPAGASAYHLESGYRLGGRSDRRGACGVVQGICGADARDLTSACAAGHPFAQCFQIQKRV